MPYKDSYRRSRKDIYGPTPTGMESDVPMRQPVTLTASVPTREPKKISRNIPPSPLIEKAVTNEDSTRGLHVQNALGHIATASELSFGASQRLVSISDNDFLVEVVTQFYDAYPEPEQSQTERMTRLPQTAADVIAGNPQV